MHYSYFLFFVIFSFFSKECIFSEENRNISPSIIYISQENSSFVELPISDREKEIISKIVKTMADSSLPRLLWKKSEMESMGKKIHHVHPLRCRGHLFSRKDHVHHLYQISKSSFKWKAFIEGLGGRLSEEATRHNLEPHLVGFANHVNGNLQIISEMVAQQKWESLVRYLMETSFVKS